jgi:phage baseplate assembly protein W
MPQRLKAISVPMRYDSTGFPAPAFNDRVLHDMIRTIILTVPGERVMRPTYGCWAKIFLFDTLNQAMASRVEFEIRRSIQEWEPRVDVLGVELTLVKSSARVNVHISWRAADDVDRQSTIGIEGAPNNGN